MVGVAQLVRVPDCDSGCRGFESHRPPHMRRVVRSDLLTPWLSRRSGGKAGVAQVRDAQVDRSGPLAQLVEQQTLNLLDLGSSPRRPTTSSLESCGLAIRRPRACCALMTEGVIGAPRLLYLMPTGAKVAELVDALDLGSSGVTRESSSLSFRTRCRRGESVSSLGYAAHCAWCIGFEEQSCRFQLKMSASSSAS